MIKDTGGPAFPGKQKALLIKRQHADIVNEYDIEKNGMTLRDYFAAKAMQGLMASSAEHNHADELIFKAVAMAAYKQADAMLEARKGGAA